MEKNLGKNKPIGTNIENFQKNARKFYSKIYFCNGIKTNVIKNIFLVQLFKICLKKSHFNESGVMKMLTILKNLQINHPIPKTNDFFKS